MAALLAVITRQAARPISDPDTFWHLRLGHDILASRSLATPDGWPASGGQDWVLTQWLPEVVAAKFEDWFGLPGVAWLFGSGLLVLTLLVYRSCRRDAGITAAAFATGLCVVGMGASLSPRPHIVTYILLVITLGAWLRSSTDHRPRWWLIPLTWAWAASHGMWFTGVIVGLAVVAGLALDKQVAPRELSRLVSVPILSILAAGLTPVGPQLLLAPFAVGGISSFIAEWQPPSFRSIGPAMTMVMIALVAMSWARLGQRVPWTRILLLLVATGWTLLAVRTVTLGAIMIAPLAAVAVHGWLRREPEPLGRRESRLLLGFGAICLIMLAVAVPRTSDQPAGVPSDLNPQLEALPSDTLVLNAYEIGGWLRWRHQSLNPLIDGLTEAYSIEQLADYGQLMSVAEGWDEIVQDSGADYAVLPEGSPLATALKGRLGWVQTGDNDGYVMLRATGQPAR